MIPAITLISWIRNLPKTILVTFIKISVRTIEIFPGLGILRPLLSISQNLPLKQKRRLDSHSCPYDVPELEPDQLPKIKIIEATSISEAESPRGIGNYISKLFSEMSISSFETVVFIAFTSHNSSSMYPRYFHDRDVYYIDSECGNCFTLIQYLSKSTERITFTSYFHENVSAEHCSTLVRVIPESNVIVYDLIPKEHLLNFANLSKMKTYFAKYYLLTEANLYAISSSTKAKLEAEGFQVRDVLKYKLIKATTPAAQKDMSILLFGSMSPRKNVLRTVIAWDLIQREFPHFKLILIGHYSNAAKFIILNVLKSDINSVRFTGEISDLELHNLFQRSKLLIAPSTLEGLGLPLIKAIEYGLPFICSDIDSYRELVANKESYFNPISIKEISQKIRSTINSPDKYITDIDSVKIGTIDFSQVV